ncbi:MAG: outer membrane protein assembly factor BamD [Prevotellaceae bacterium]|nr:outer membrane protein assembly factor BamD [Prevotella sp.]MDD7247922.1 outer membrane protein assembly factor BamD [Prevotellaceae bacterium]MDY2749174.1 outer membrane protein assembly factor BamD [Prevotella sp.]
MNRHLSIFLLLATVLLASCAKEFNAVYKSTDYDYRYEYAKEQYMRGNFQRASLILGDMVTLMKGTEKGEECLFLYGMATYNGKDYESAAEIFKKYYTSYPKGVYAELASFNVGECIYATVPEPRLDQAPTYQAMKAYQDFMDVFPFSIHKGEAEKKLYDLQDKLVMKELINARLYYNLGTYFGNCGTNGGNNYEACIVTAQNALKDYPFTTLREEFAVLIMKSKYELAVHSVKEKQAGRFQDAEDECYGFINEYPDSKEKATAERYIEKCKKFTAGIENF